MVASRMAICPDHSAALSYSKIFIKPLPAYLLDLGFWEENPCDDNVLHESAYCFLLSYAWLISHESGFQIAIATDDPTASQRTVLASVGDFMEDFLHGIDLDDSKYALASINATSSANFAQTGLITAAGQSKHEEHAPSRIDVYGHNRKFL